jgi:hypothetical protein
MTEAEWLVSLDQRAIVTFLRGKVSKRKLRLLAIACSVAIRPLLGQHALHVLEVAERFADGLASKEDLTRARTEARRAEKTAVVRLQPDLAWAARPARLIGNESITEVVGDVLSYLWSAQPWPRIEVLLRDLFGNPFRPVVLDPVCRSADVVALAQAAYADRPHPGHELNGILPGILADALEEAGCTEQAILDHLRGPGPHVRGCWAVDLVLGKS